MNWKIGLAGLCVAAAACDLTGPGGSGSAVAIRFGTSHSPAARADLGVAKDLTVTGTNATLVLQDVRFIVEEMKLRSSESTSACSDDDIENEHEGGDDDILVGNGLSVSNDVSHDGDDDEEDECEVEGGPFIVDLNLNGATTVSTIGVPAGTYDSFRFKIDDLEGDNDDERDDRVNSASVLSEMRTAYPDFPARASMVVRGTQDGQPFTVYFRSKLKITQPIDPPLVVPADDVLSVNIDPTLWFRSGTQVLNLVALNGKLVELGEGFRIGIRGSHRGDD